MNHAPDTNILLCLRQPDHPQWAACTRAIGALIERGDCICLLPQTLYEFWNVSTRPKMYNGLGQSAAEVFVAVTDLQNQYTTLYDSVAIYQEWLSLVRSCNVMGAEVHDARIAAAVRVHKFDSLISYNVKDFKRYGIKVIHPRDV